jgi:hypothetical protein
MRHDSLLGCGEQGCTYDITGAPDKVIKITPFWDNKKAKPSANTIVAVEDKWYKEACLGVEMGRLNLGPRIFSFFACDEKGYIVMNKISLADKFFVRTRGKDSLVVVRHKVDAGFAAVDHIGLMLKSMQLGFAKKLAIMIDHGFIHMDNHIGNLGFIFGTQDPILFDFGFTQERVWGGNKDKAWALAFSLFQMIEHCPVEEIEGTEIFRIATAILSGTWSWGDDMSSGTGLTMAALKKLYPESGTLRAFKALAATAAERATNVDVYVGSMLYAKLITMDKPLWVSTDVDAIYFIRQGKPY